MEHHIVLLMISYGFECCSLKDFCSGVLTEKVEVDCWMFCTGTVGEFLNRRTGHEHVVVDGSIIWS